MGSDSTALITPGDVEPFQSRVLGILPVEYEGVGFYVFAVHAEICRRVLREAGLLEGLVEEAN